MSIVVNDVSPRVHHVATDGQTVFTVPFAWILDTHLKVYVNEVLCTFDAPPLDSMHYSTTGVGTSNGGSITFGPPGRNADDHVVIFRDMPIARTSDMPTSGVFPVATLNDTFDNQTAMIQQTEVNVQERTLGMAVNDFVQPLKRIPNRSGRAGKILGFDNDGQPMMYAPGGLGGGGGGGGGDGIGNTNQHWTGDEPPPQPWQDGDLWWESDTGALHIFYVDVDSGQWVEASAGSGGTPDVSHLINPKWYDVLGNGVADDTAAFQATITAAAGRVVWIDGLNIVVNSTIIVPPTGMHLAGNGKITFTGTGTLFQGAQVDMVTYSFVATANQTTFTHADPYTGSFIEVYFSGLLIRPIYYTFSHDTANLTMVTVPQAAGVQVDLKVYRINPTAGVLNAFSRVIIGTGVQILTTQRMSAHAFVLGWPDDGYVPGRQFPAFLMEAGAVIRGVDGNTGFNNAIWLSGWQASQINGYIFGVGANQIPNIIGDNLQCQSAVLLTGKFTSSDLRCTGGQFGFVHKAIMLNWDAVEGISCTNMTFLNVGYAIWAEGRTTDVGMQIGMIHCHCAANHGVLFARNFLEVYVSDCNLFQHPNSTEEFFQFVEIWGGTNHLIHNNDMRTFVNGSNCTGVRMEVGSRGARVYGNQFNASDAASVFFGMVCANTVFDCVIGPNTYYQGARALNALSGSNRIGALTHGDVFVNQPTLAKYVFQGTNWWVDNKWFRGSIGTVAIPNATLITMSFSEIRDPELVFGGGNTITVPVWASNCIVRCRLSYQPNPTGVRMGRIMLDGGETAAKSSQTAASTVVGFNTLNFAGEFAVNPGQAITLQTYQNSGASLDIYNGELYVLFW